MRRAVMVGMVVGLMSAAGGASGAVPITDTKCVEHEVWADGDAAAVARRLPAGYTAVTDGGTGAPLIFARAEHCADGLVLGDYGIVVDSPDGYGCASGLPGVGPNVGNLPPMCDWYTLSFAFNRQSLVDWLQQDTPSVPAAYVPDLVYDESRPDANGNSTLHFAAPSFTIDDVSSFRPGTISLRGAYYFPDTPQGRVKMLVSTDDLEAGHADTTLRATAGSELAQLMGATERPSVEPYNEFGVIRIGHGVLRKQLLGPALPGERLDSLAGSCSLKGDVTFDPPATDTQKPEHYVYDAVGTCSGTLDGRPVSGAAVHMHQAGDADASCNQALTSSPGDGALVFGDGTSLPYTVDFESTGTEVDGSFYGTRSGWATIHSTFATQRTSPTVAADCAGAGVKKTPMDLTLTTQSPLVSGQPVPSASRTTRRPVRHLAKRHRARGHHRKHRHRHHRRHRGRT